ncbi:MAG: DNA-directed RNA polymerase subunit beta [Nitrospirae bacterium]|nr:DNA-directed RNA polymerase subunit beta [Nitrospirota bacterium]
MSNPIIKGCIERKDFSKIPAKIEIPELLEIQKKSFERFLQKDVPLEQREDIGLQAAFSSVFPISDFNTKAILRFTEYSLGEPKYEIWECIERGMTYAVPIKIRVSLEILEKDEKSGARSTKEVREQWVYLGELPLMTDNGTFIINGTERVVVSQLQRSPGAFFTHDKGRTHISGKVLFSARIIPYRGSWLDFEFDTKDILYARIDRRRKFPSTILLKAIGYSTHDVLKLYYPVEDVYIRNKKFYSRVDAKVLSGSRIPYDIINEQNGEIVVKEGNRITHGILKKLENLGIKEVPLTVESLLDRIALDKVVGPSSGEIIVGSNSALTEELIDKIIKSGVEKINLLYIDNFQVFPIIRDTLLQENIDSQEAAIIEIYKRLRPGESPTADTAKVIFDNLFFNPKRYDLAPVGRLKLNKKLGINVLLSQRTLTPQDIVETVRYLINLKANKGDIDDIDHLGNRRVRCVGELLENQFRIGLARMERSIKERMNILDLENTLPHDLINAKSVIAAVKEFFGSSQLSQFMDQTNPLSEITHKRRLSALGPGGLTRERAGFEVRDVHPTHYGRICPIETPEGPNIGLITSLSTYARVNEFGFIESPYRKVLNGKVTDQIEYLSAIDGDRYHIAQASTPVDASGEIISETVSARYGGDFVMVSSDKVEYMDVSPKQIVSVATSLIPFLENDDANRALMGSNMQRQAVPLIHTDAPLVGTGMEKIIARDSGRVVLAKRAGVVEYVDANRIVVRADETKPGGKSKKEKTASEEMSLDIYNLVKFKRSNQNTCISQKPIVSAGQKLEKGQVLADGPATRMGELALGQNILVAFMPWEGYNFEDAIIISERIAKEERYTSIHIEEFEIEARDTKLGKEEITMDIPNVSEELLRNLDESGIVRIGAEVKPGDILVAKVAPKGETQLTPEEKLLRAIFGEKAGDVKDVSLVVPPGIEGTVVDVKIFSRKGVEKDERSKSIENEEVARLQKEQQEEVRIIEEEKGRRLRRFFTGKVVGKPVTSSTTRKTILQKKKEITENLLKELKDEDLANIALDNPDDMEKVEEICNYAQQQIDILQTIYEDKIGRVKKGDELPPGVIKLVKVYVAIKRKLSVGDKMAGRHGNKGVISVIMPEEDMPYLADGTPVGMILNPLGVPSRMNVGQILETHLGWAARALGIHVTTPVFEGTTEAEIKGLLKEAGLPVSGQAVLYDGRTGAPFDREVTVGYMYMMKLHHLVDDKIHARSIGPYSLVTQQPLGGKAQFGGQRLGEMEVWALQAYGAAATLQEFLTVKSDDVPGRSKMYESIVKGENFLTPGLPESFNVLIKELQSLGLDVELLKYKEKS